MSEVEVKELDAVEVMSLPFTGPYEQTQDYLDQLMSWLLRVGHPYSARPIGLYYHDPAKTNAEELRAEVCLPIQEACDGFEDVTRKTLPAVTVASVSHTGPYAGLHEVYSEVFDWMAQNGYRPVEGEPTREVFHRMRGQVDDPVEFVTEVQVPVARPESPSDAADPG